MELESESFPTAELPRLIIVFLITLDLRSDRMSHVRPPNCRENTSNWSMHQNICIKISAHASVNGHMDLQINQCYSEKQFFQTEKGMLDLVLNRRTNMKMGSSCFLL